MSLLLEWDGANIWKDACLGAIDGVIVGIIIAVVAFLLYKNGWFGLAIGLGRVLNLIIAGLAGSSIPILMKKMGVEPAQSFCIILTR